MAKIKKAWSNLKTANKIIKGDAEKASRALLRTLGVIIIMNKRIINHVITIFFFSVILAGCGESSDTRYDSGFSDGYAEGYNTTCKIRATMVKGDWDDEHYSKGYQDGRADGAADCRAKR